MERLKIGLFIGGSSSEKEISLESGRHVYNNLNREKYEVLPIFVDSCHRFWQISEALMWKNTAKDLEESLSGAGAQRIYWEDLKSLIDFAFICLHGKFGEEAVLGLLEILNIPNNGASVLGGALSMDKFTQRKVLEAEGLCVPRYVGISANDWENDPGSVTGELESSLGYPFMVKPSREGSSTALNKVKSREEIESALTQAFKYDNVILAEEVLEGMELTTLVYGAAGEAKALPPSQLLKRGDFLTAEEKFLPGGAQMITPPPVTEDLVKKIQEESIKVFRSLGLKVYSRIDSFLTGDLKTVAGSKVVVLEPNNPPAMTPSTAMWLQAAEAGFNAAQFLDEIINISREAHRGKLGPL